MRRNGRPSLRITDFSDRELLALIKDVEDTEGWANAQSVAERIWPRAAKDDEFAVMARTSVNQRLGWLRREGDLVEKNDKVKFEWRLTDRGLMLLKGKVNSPTRNFIESYAEDADLLEVMSLLGERWQSTDYETGWVVKREWQFRTARR